MRVPPSPPKPGHHAREGWERQSYGAGLGEHSQAFLPGAALWLWVMAQGTIQSWGFAEGCTGTAPTPSSGWDSASSCSSRRVQPWQEAGRGPIPASPLVGLVLHQFSPNWDLGKVPQSSPLLRASPFSTRCCWWIYPEKQRVQSSNLLLRHLCVPVDPESRTVNPLSLSQ